MLSSGGSEPKVREIPDLEAQFGDRDLTSQLSIRGLLCTGGEGPKYPKIISVRNGRGLQRQDSLGLLDRNDSDGSLTLNQKIVNLVRDLVHLPHYGQGRCKQ